jgi:uncharacterized Zn-finger protein
MRRVGPHNHRMEALVDAASAAVAIRFADGKAPRGIKWWKNGVCAYWCDLCDKAFSKSWGLVTHTRTHTNERPYSCTFEGCDKAFSKSWSLVTHTRTHTNERPYSCTFEGCDYTCAASGTLVTHTRTHTKERPYVCTFEGCDYSCSRSGNLVNHTRTHTNERPYSCAFPGCDSSFTASGHLKAHTRTHTNERPYSCTFEGCDKAFSKSNHLVVHTRTHTKERPYVCTFPGCDSSFTASGSLAKHTRIHTNERPYSCAFPGCDSCFTESGHLKTHTRTHTNERPYSCTFEGCDSSFITSGQLVTHTRIHTNERPYSCTFDGCDRSFKQSGDLAKHTRTHTNERPYACTFPGCDSSFTESGHLSKHLEGIHDIGKFKCDYCLGNRNSHNKHYDEAGKTNVHICRSCYKKATGFTSRVEKRWCEYTDEHLGTAGLMGSDDSLRSLGGCSMNRPDRLYGDQHTVELDECDEKQHSGSSYTCEQRRISDFYNEPSICGKSMVVIRWNPDGYKPLPGRDKVTLKERMRLFVMLKMALREKRAEPLPKIIVFFMFYSRDNSSITADFPHFHVDSELDIRTALKEASCRAPPQPL